MKIKEIKINNYGNLEDVNIDLKNGINIIYGKNESGKSTLLNYIKNILFGISKNKNGKEISDYEKYKPWGNENYSGKLKYELDNGNEFEIFRDFNKKNPKIFNNELNDITKDFENNKKDGIQFFYEQTGVDETTFTSTVLSMQNQVKLDKQEQNILIQKLANLAGTGDDNLSYKKLIDKLNKIQIEEIGSDRSQARPINIVKEKIKEDETILKELQAYKQEKAKIENEKKYCELKINNLQSELDILNKINLVQENNKKEEEKINIKQQYVNEKNKKIEDLNSQIQEIKSSEKKENIKLNKKINIKKYIIILLFLLMINILIFIFNKNKLINILNYFFIPIYLIIIFIIEKNKKIKINKKIKLENEKINNEINLINKQIEIIKEEKNNEEKEIKKEQINLDNNMEIEINNIKKYLKNEEEINNYLNKLEENNLKQNIIDKQDELNKIRLELQTIKINEEHILNKLENISNIKEEYESLKEELNELEEKNEIINLTKEFLNRAYLKMKNNITPKFTENLSKNISKISNNKYNKVSLNEDKGLIVENQFGDYVPAERLSIGTIDQLYLSLRLSMIDDLSEEKMPIILDEAFAYYDDYRLENILKFLNGNSNNHQIIIFSCTNREIQILNKLNMEYNLVNI